MSNDDRAALRASLDQARRRALAALPASPEWEAATAGVDALEQVFDRLERRDSVAGHGVGGTTVTFVGPFVLADDLLVQGTLAGRTDHVEIVRSSVSSFAPGMTRRAFLEGLERLAAEHGFVLETSRTESGGMAFYVWQSEPEGDRAPGG